MQLSASGLFLGLITGLLGVWLYLWQADRQHNDYRVGESRVECKQARFDVEFAGRHASQALKDREAEACGEASNQVAARKEAEIKAKKEADQLKQSIEKALTSEQAQAEMQASAASAVAATVSAGAEAIKKSLK